MLPEKKIVEILPKQDVLTLRPTMSVGEAARLMAYRGVGAALVTEGTALKGIFTERDVLEKVVAAGRDPDRTMVAEVMTARPVTISLQTSVREALRAMRERHLRHLPVMRDGGIVGIVSMRDFLMDEAINVGA